LTCFSAVHAYVSEAATSSGIAGIVALRRICRRQHNLQAPTSRLACHALNRTHFGLGNPAVGLLETSQDEVRILATANRADDRPNPEREDDHANDQCVVVVRRAGEGDGCGVSDGVLRGEQEA
jgi:hypothetical protein